MDASLIGPLVALQGTPAAIYSGTDVLRVSARLALDYRHLRSTDGTISDQVVLKTTGGEVPVAMARVWLLRAADGYKAWEGWSDAAGNYTATGLEVGVEYVMLAIDPTKQHKTTGAGPKVAA